VNVYGKIHNPSKVWPMVATLRIPNQEPQEHVVAPDDILVVHAREGVAGLITPDDTEHDDGVVYPLWELTWLERRAT
jgi:hypothetical protein